MNLLGLVEFRSHEVLWHPVFRDTSRKEVLDCGSWDLKPRSIVEKWLKLANEQIDEEDARVARRDPWKGHLKKMETTIL